LWTIVRAFAAADKEEVLVTYFLIGLQIGGALGFLLAACMGAARRDDDTFRTEVNFLRAQPLDAAHDNRGMGRPKA
jgi:ABC-type nitrate/sulfonate/bicarbonate transport system permease component